jgi:hypothetical protein
LLRGLLDQLSTDLVMISLLDDHTQSFISGASNENCNDAKVTLESTQWYGCDEVTHHGELCERTIAVEETPGEPGAMYEVLDMATDERTRDLPFVNGEIASFRHYVGSPITTPAGYSIGTVSLWVKTLRQQATALHSDNTFAKLPGISCGSSCRQCRLSKAGVLRHTTQQSPLSFMVPRTSR